MNFSGTKAARGTLLFMISALAVKALGAVYKIPLYNLLGGYGIGLYQMVFPVYALLLTLSGSGVPSALTKLIGGGADAAETLKKSLKIFLSVGIVFTVITLVFCRSIAKIQGDVNAALCYAAICPSIAIVSAIACFRGYFQGKGTFSPTALSQLIEQIIKMAVGLTAVILLGKTAAEKAAWCCLAVTASEFCALLFLLIKYLSQKRAEKEKINYDKIKAETGEKNGVGLKKLLGVVLPLTLTSLFLPFASFADSFIVINLLKTNFTDATALYGLYSGGADTVIGLPVAVLLALALGFLPQLSKKAENSSDNGSGSIEVLAITAALAACACVGIIIFAPIIVRILFYNLPNYRAILINLLRLASVNVVFLSLLQTTNTILLAKGKQFFPLFSIPLGIAIKIALVIILVGRPQINIFGMAISDIACYFVALIANLVYIIYCKRKDSKHFGGVNIMVGAENQTNGL